MKTVSVVIDLMSKVREYFRESKAKLANDGILKLRRYSERARSINGRHRYYTRGMLMAQLQPGRQANLIDEILLSMDKEALARQVIPGLWEIVPFASVPVL